MTSDEVCTVKIRYKRPQDSTSSLIEQAFTKRALAGSGSKNLDFAASVAEMGLLLRNSEFKGTASFGDLLKRANAALGSDPYGERKEFVDLARSAMGMGSWDTGPYTVSGGEQVKVSSEPIDGYNPWGDSAKK